MTLIEVLVALGLTSFLMMILMMFYGEITKLNRLNDIASKESFQDRYIDNRLSQVFSNLVVEKNNQHFYFMTTDELSAKGIAKGTALIFGYYNGIKKDHRFTNDVVGALYVDKYDRLSLVTIPGPKDWNPEKTLPLHKEILMENIDSIEFKFYEPDESDVETGKVTPIKEFSKWELVKQDKEDKDAETNNPHVPIFVWMLLKKLDAREQGNRNVVDKGRGYIFVLPRRQHPIIYIK